MDVPSTVPRIPLAGASELAWPADEPLHPPSGPGGAFSAARRGAKTAWPMLACAAIVVELLSAASHLGHGRVPSHGQPVTGFVYTYPFGRQAGLRAWTLDSHGWWHERGPDGREARLFDRAWRGAVSGCQGAVTGESAAPDFLFFVPDSGCGDMSLSMKRGDAAWTTLGPMSVVSTRPADER